MKKLFTTLLLLAMLAVSAFAQWSDDPAVGTTVNDQDGSQYVPKVAATSDGGYYVGFYNSASGNIDVYLQYYDAEGNAMWADGGIAVSTHDQASSVNDWSMHVDSNDNAILAFNDRRNGNNDAYAYKISQTGEFLWGADGADVAVGSDFEDIFPVFTELTDGSFVFAWFVCSTNPPPMIMSVALNRLNADGISTLEETIILDGIEGTLDKPYITATSDGNFILVFADFSGSAWAPTIKYYARKYTPEFTEVWENDAVITDAGGIARQVTPKMFSDGNDGIIFTWRDQASGGLSSKIQRISSDGTVLFAEDGSNLSPLANELGHASSADIFPETDETIVAWRTSNTDQNSFGIRAQLISNTGEFQWGDNGFEIFSINAGLNLGDIDVKVVNGNAIISWIERQDNVSQTDLIKAVCLDEDHNYVWEEATLISSTPTSKMDKVSELNINNVLCYVWNGADHIYAQNLNADGTLGAPVPAITITSPVEGYAFNQLPLSIEFTLENFLMNESTPAEGDGVIKVELDDSQIAEYASTDPFVIDEMENGEHTIIMTLIDGPDGDPFEPNIADTLTVTYNTPAIMITSPENGSEFNLLPLTIEFTVGNFEINEEHPAEGDGVIKVELDDTQIAELANQNPYVIDNLSGGEHTIIMTLIDGPDGSPLVPNIADTLTITYNVPTIAITSPEEGAAFNRLPISIEFEVGNFEMNSTTPADGDGVIKIDVDGTELMEYTGEDAIVIDELDEGTHTVIMTLIDGPDGNPFDPSIADTITVNYNIPTIEITTPAANADLTALPIEVEFTLANFTINEETPADGDGIIMVLIDGAQYAQVAETSSLTINEMDNGEHTITLVLFDGMDGNPWEPDVRANVTVTLTVNSVDPLASNIPTEFTLKGNYPNPFNARTTIKFGLPNNDDLKMSIYSITGQKVMEYNQDAMNAGWHIVTWDASRVSSGVYFVQVRSGKEVLTHKMMLVK